MTLQKSLARITTFLDNRITAALRDIRSGREAAALRKHYSLTKADIRALLEGETRHLETAQDAAKSGDYVSREDCISAGEHLVDCDDDGYCNNCGHQDDGHGC